MNMLLPLCLAGALLIAPAVEAKLPAPTPEAKAKLDEAVAKTAAGDKINAYKLCLAQDRIAASYFKASAAAGKPHQSVADLPACSDPGPYVAAQPETRVGIADAAPLNKEPVKK